MNDTLRWDSTGADLSVQKYTSRAYDPTFPADLYIEFDYHDPFPAAFAGSAPVRLGVSGTCMGMSIAFLTYEPGGMICVATHAAGTAIVEVESHGLTLGLGPAFNTAAFAAPWAQWISDILGPSYCVEGGVSVGIGFTTLACATDGDERTWNFGLGFSVGVDVEIKAAVIGGFSYEETSLITCFGRCYPPE